MATITATSKSGSVGPSTFSTSTRYGTVERQRVQGRNPRSLAQQNHRSFVHTVTGSWRERTVAGYAAPAAALDLTAAYVKRFGAPAAGQKVFVRLRPVNDGFKGEPVQCVAILAARAA